MPYFAEVQDGDVVRVIVANTKQWCEKRLGGTWQEASDPYAASQAPGLESVTYPGPGYGVDPTFPERFAAKWVPPAPDPETGVWSSYARGDVRSHNGSLWKSTLDNNVWEPGVSGWHPEPEIEGVRPTWIQPTGSHDTWALGIEVVKGGKFYRSEIDDNATEPGAQGSEQFWTKIDEDGKDVIPEPTLEPWIAGGGTGVAGSYNQDINWGGTESVEVSHPNAQDGGNVWRFRSKIPANTTEPGTDGTLHRYWEPVERV